MPISFDSHPELAYPGPLKIGSRGRAVRRLQEWLLFAGIPVSGGADGDFGDGTAQAMIAFQRKHQSQLPGPVDGMLSLDAWTLLTAPMRQVLMTPLSGNPAADVVKLAQAHLAIGAREVGPDNHGPWPRLYCGGLEVQWCQGFVNFLTQQAYDAAGQPTPWSLAIDLPLYVPAMVVAARQAGHLASTTSEKQARIQPGAMVFFRSQPGAGYSHFHVELVEKVNGNGTFDTIGGNTNDDGSSNGIKVCRRTKTATRDRSLRIDGPYDLGV